MTLLPQIRDQLDAAAHQRASAPQRRALTPTWRSIRFPRSTRIPTLGNLIAAVATLTAIAVAGGALVALSHRHPTNHHTTPATPSIHPTTPATPGSPGSRAALAARVRDLRGRPIVITVWASWCRPCQHENALIRQAARENRGRIAFLGVDLNDTRRAAAAFLGHHPLPFSNYQSSLDLRPIIPVTLTGVPETIFIAPVGGIVFVHVGAYTSRATLAADISKYAPSDPRR
jgi:cytochrome c biogenesis protein CcmG, thiol:disulfide interchange protein DsbE